MRIVSTYWCHSMMWADLGTWSMHQLKCCTRSNWKWAYHHCKSGLIGTLPDASSVRPSPPDPVARSSTSDVISCSSILVCFLRLARYCLTSSMVAQLFLKQLRYGWCFLAYGIALELVPVSFNAKKTHHFKYISQVACTLLTVRSLQVEASFMAKGTNSALGKQVEASVTVFT